MGLRTKAYFIGVFLAVISPMAAALGLGEIKLNSALNQPLNAEIQLLHVRDLTEGEIRIAIASPEEFARAGVERNFFVTDLKFTLDLTASQGPVVRVTSNGPVREPFLNFIVSARWPSGKLLREYTLLVDLPVFSGAQSAPVQAASQAPAQQSPAVTTPSPAPRTTPPRQRTEPAAGGNTFTGDSYGPVSANETLWSIAARVKPDSSVSVQQTMLAIQRMNPQAFINGNINLLRRGQVLRIPDKDEIQQLSSRDAVQQVAAQNRSWNDRTPAPERAQLEGSKNFTETRTESSAIEGRVKLSSPPSETATGQGTGADDSGGGEGVSEELTQAQEELDAADRENSDLKSRISAMEEQIQTMERLVEVSSEEMRALELAAQQANQEQADQGVEQANQDIASTQNEPGVPVDNDAESPPADASSEQTAQPEVQPEPQITPPANATPPRKSWIDLAMDNLLYIGIGLGVLVLGLVIYLFKRSRREEYDEYDGYDGEGDMDLAAAGDADEQADKTVPLNDYDDDRFVEEERALAEAETEDVVGECDIHIAYGQYDQAEEKLLRALEKDPTNAPVRLKLLEVFALQGDADNFDQHYARLRATGDSDAIDRATVMRSSIEGIEPFDASLYATHESGTERRYDSAMDDAFATSASLGDDALDFDFNDVDELVDSSSGHSAEQAGYQADSLDFDLTLDDDDVTQIPSNKFAGTQHSDNFVGSRLPSDEPVTQINDLKLETGFGDEISADMDFELQQEDLAVDSNHKSPDDFAAEFDLEFEEDKFTNEFADDLVAERAAPKDEESFDFGDLELTTESDPGYTYAAADTSESLDFDLDRDLADAQTTSKEPPVLSSAAENMESGLDDLELEELDGMGVDSNVEPDPARVSSSSVSSRPSDNTTDFDMDFDLDKEINLDELDHELDALASDFGGATAGMEEPVLNFDDEIDSTDTAGLVEQDDPSDEQDLDDLFAEEDTKPPIREVASKSTASPIESANSGLDFEIPDFDPENDDDSNLDFLSDNDETATKLDLARAYIDMGDSDGAKDILDEIMDEGNDQQKREAETLLARIG